MSKSACMWLGLGLALASAGAAAQTTVTTTGGTTNTVPVFTGSSTVGNSPIAVSGSNVGIGTSPAFPLDVSGFSRFAQGARIQPTASTGDVWYYYPNVVSYTYDGSAQGAIVLHTNIGRTSGEMFKIRVNGYGYGNSSNIDFTVVGYAYGGVNGSVDGHAGAINGYSLNDNGNDGLPKWVGVDVNGNVAIAIGNYSSSYYFYRVSADYWSTRNTVNASSGWSISPSSTSGFAFLDIHQLPSTLQLNNGSDNNSSQSNAVLYSSSYNNPGVELGNGGYASLAGFLYGGNNTGNGSYYGTLVGINAAYNGTNWLTWNGFIQPEAILIGSGLSGSNMGLHFLTSKGLNQGGTPATYTPYEAMTIQDNGNVGIGTTSPAYPLSVNGQVNATSYCISAANCITSWPTGNAGTVTSITAGSGLSGGTITGSGTVSLNTGSANTWSAMQTFSANTNFPYGTWSTSGNLGIGTTTPGYLLDVEASSDGSNLELANFHTSDAHGSSYISVGNTNNSTQIESNAGAGGPFRYGTYVDSVISNPYTGTGAYGSLQFGTGGSTRMTIVGGTGSTSGNVGIGTTSPSALFSVGPSSQFQVNSSGAISTSGGLTVSGGSLSLPSASIQNSFLQGTGSLTVTAGAGLSGGGAVALGGTTALSLPQVGTAGTYGSATQVPVFTTDTYGRITGVTNTTIAGTGGSSAWSAVTNPTANLALSTGSYTTTFTAGSTTGTNNLFEFADTASNTGTGNLVDISTAASSTLKPFAVYAAGGSNPSIEVLANGNVGIGTITPGAMLEVNGSVKLTANSGGSITFQDGTTQSTAYTGVTCGGDYAESVDVTGGRTSYEPGDLLVIDPNAPGRFLKSNEAYSTLVAGIYSTKPGTVGRRQTTDAKTTTTEVPMAMVGIVPTKVTAENGPIKTGDLLVASSTLGRAMKGTDRSRMLGAVIGKALGNLDAGTGVIEIVVTLQ